MIIHKCLIIHFSEVKWGSLFNDFRYMHSEFQWKWVPVAFNVLMQIYSPHCFFKTVFLWFKSLNFRNNLLCCIMTGRFKRMQLLFVNYRENLFSIVNYDNILNMSNARVNVNPAPQAGPRNSDRERVCLSESHPCH